MARFILKSRKFGVEEFYTRSGDESGYVYTAVRDKDGTIRDCQICKGGEVDYSTPLTACGATIGAVVRRWHRQRLASLRPLILPIFVRSRAA